MLQEVTLNAVLSHFDLPRLTKSPFRNTLSLVSDQSLPPALSPHCSCEDEEAERDKRLGRLHSDVDISSQQLLLF